eukprot:CAMPEP_0118971306 /NCGR_PEP_ID=MMETSP1173-20130426/7973_1 /TAXON_ID=1034831 /ORGANISM="Rhizochromulina marina cf, Strain CCMP1243" /LENGTH=96 /DNA_ID=CAMNT_0006920747 /DNA_START=1 /DNA_END=287 /DNA_ORIENTATION=-
MLRSALSIALGGGLASVVLNYTGPFLLHHSEVVLPFAAANMVAATFWYSVLESTAGLETMSGSLSQLFKESAFVQQTLPKMLAKAPLPYGGVVVGG